ncbi:MAG: type II restriction endonuclease [Alistipes sp.]|nr:type II restriction endonuclease [Alistipes sp.]
MRNFEQWIGSFRKSIADYTYYIDFKKTFRNVDKIKIELNILNTLVGSRNIESDFENIVTKYPETLKCIPILLAKRDEEIDATDTDGEFKYDFRKMNYSIEQYKIFMRKTGLFDLLSNHLINNVVDYVTGVEAGLDSNGRKNRGGHLMENLVEMYLIKAGFVKNVTYFKEITNRQVEAKFGLDLSSVFNKGKTKKRFDFVVKVRNRIYIIETNFYKSHGSKLNETARSYKAIALETKNMPDLRFVWFTDGQGWFHAKSNLRETFEALPDLYSINDLENGIMQSIFK